MTEKIVEVVARILDGLNRKIPIEDVNKSLSLQKEFDKQIVSAAFSLVYDKILGNKRLARKNRLVDARFRLLTEEEKEVLGQDNEAYLLHLYNVGVLGPVDFEMVLEQLMLFPGDTITKDDINWTVYISLLNINDEFLPGSRWLLSSTDTIN